MLSYEYKEYVSNIAAEIRSHAIAVLYPKGCLDIENPLVMTIDIIERVIRDVYGGQLEPESTEVMMYESLGEGKFKVHYDRHNVSVSDLIHELGHHFLLHDGEKPPQEGIIARNPLYAGDDKRGTNAFGDNREMAYHHEMAVNHFERAFLLPEREFRNAVKKSRLKEDVNETTVYKCDVVTIANKFAVSYDLVETRLRDLGMWDSRNIHKKQRSTD